MKMVSLLIKTDLPCLLMNTAPTHGPTNLTVVDIGPTHIRIRWDHPPNDTHQGIVRLYKIYVAVEETEQTYFYTTTADNTELLLAYLHPYYTYHMRVAAVTVEEGNSTFLSAKTDESGMCFVYAQSVVILLFPYLQLLVDHHKILRLQY